MRESRRRVNIRQTMRKSLMNDQNGWPNVAGLFFLQNKVPSPGEPVANGKEQQGIPRMPEDECSRYDGHTERRAYGVQDAIARVAMLPQVELKELVVRCELLWLGHGVIRLGGAR